MNLVSGEFKKRIRFMCRSMKMEFCVLFAAIIILLFCNQITAQINLSVETGLNQSNLIFANFTEVGWQYKPGFFIGIRTNVSVKERLTFYSTLQVSEKGWSTKNSNSTVRDYFYVDLLNYISFRLNHGIEIYGGLNLARIINRESTRKFDVGHIIGVLVKISKFRLFSHVNTGFVDTSIDTQYYLGKPVKGLNRNYQIGLSYELFTFRKK